MLSFWINLYVNASQNNSQGIVLSFYHALHAVRLIQMPAKEKKRSCLFSSATAKRKKPKDSLALIGLIN